MFPADLVTFTEKILDIKLFFFFCSDSEALKQWERFVWPTVFRNRLQSFLET